MMEEEIVQERTSILKKPKNGSKNRTSPIKGGFPFAGNDENEVGEEPVE